MTETESRGVAGDLAVRVSRELSKIGYVIRSRDGFTKFIEPAPGPLVFRVLEDRPGEKARWRFKVLRPAPQKVPEAHVSRSGS